MSLTGYVKEDFQDRNKPVFDSIFENKMDKGLQDFWSYASFAIKCHLMTNDTYDMKI